MSNSKSVIWFYLLIVLIVLAIESCNNPSKKLLILNQPVRDTSSLPNQIVKDTSSKNKSDLFNINSKLPPCTEPTSDSANEYKYPLKTINIVQIAEFIKSRNYASVESVFIDVQDKFERDFRNEFCFFEAFQIFTPWYPGMLAIIEEWQKAFPGSANPLAALAKYYYEIGWDARGEKTRANTRQGQIDTMKQNFSIAMNYADRALEINPKHYECYMLKLDMTMATGDRETNIATFNMAVKMSPYAVHAWISFLNCVCPQWGGSYEIMQRVVDMGAPLKDCNPFFDVLQGCIYENIGVLTGDNDDEAITYYTKAIQCAKYSHFYGERANRYELMKKIPDALHDLDSAIALQPQHAFRHLRRSELLFNSALISGREKKIEYFKKSLGDYSFAYAIVPMHENVTSWRKLFDTLNNIANRRNQTELAVIGNWYIWKEKGIDGKLRYYTINDSQQVRVIRFTKCKDYIFQNGQVLNVTVKYKWKNGYYWTLNELTNNYDYCYKVSVKGDLLYMAEIDNNGNLITEDVYKPYPYATPPKWGK